MLPAVTTACSGEPGQTGGWKPYSVAKRLTVTYPMINKDKLLHQNSDMVAMFVMHGWVRMKVIDALDQLSTNAFLAVKK